MQIDQGQSYRYKVLNFIMEFFYKQVHFEHFYYEFINKSRKKLLETCIFTVCDTKNLKMQKLKYLDIVG